MTSFADILIPAVSLLPKLDSKLIALLKTLSPEDWQQQTIAKKWKVKDVVAHLLDGNIRILSMLRDNYAGENPVIHSYQDLLDYLNGLNADWVKAMKRVSPSMLILLHEATGKSYCEYYASFDPFGKAGFAVNWAGEEESKNWMHIAREYTEKWLHQQQIRDAVDKPGLMEREFFYPFIQTCIMALPYTYRDITAAENTSIRVRITGESGGCWQIVYTGDRWDFVTENIPNPTATVEIDPDTSWRLFSKSIRPAEVMHKIVLKGDIALAEHALHMISFMA
ncbi:MAG: maleylpyruvate isomerase N-terminal domain-containing protein [Bacteroidota bacterium]